MAGKEGKINKNIQWKKKKEKNQTINTIQL